MKIQIFRPNLKLQGWLEWKAKWKLWRVSYPDEMIGFFQSTVESSQHSLSSALIWMTNEKPHELFIKFHLLFAMHSNANMEGNCNKINFPTLDTITFYEFPVVLYFFEKTVILLIKNLSSEFSQSLMENSELTWDKKNVNIYGLLRQESRQRVVHFAHIMFLAYSS